MSAEQEEPEPERERPQSQGGSSKPDAAGPERRRVPPPDPDARERGKRFMVAVDRLHEIAPLSVTAQGGQVASDYAPGRLIARLGELVNKVLTEVGNGYPPMFYGALPTNSMTLFFGDPDVTSPQEELPIGVLHGHAERVARLIEVEDPEALFARALEIGDAAKAYGELAHFVESEGFTLKWQPRGQEPRYLDPERAGRHWSRLTEKPPTVDRGMTIHGTLYRVIAEPRDSHIGTVGVRLFSWSAAPERRGRKERSVIAGYETTAVEDAIKRGLIGEPVKARLLVRTPQPGTSVDVGTAEFIVDRIELGPAEHDHYGIRMDIEDEWELESGAADSENAASSDDDENGPEPQ